ncbi:Cell wall-associated hydrolase, NlpC family [Flaviramulus basaltis]|uniref:Cell wall-associated hydrolase, NlpC family n=1 Tax=Flaviramulus basaltis TaxID=369401 RepID=A0A1K2IML1_9FLAO|nr:C40 family peptidase [Flaviramulus basaltis]SFZ93490.1 Cell wall-associated hydrolase, NlpC family [Flaviramulus basaltis]
MKKIVFIIVLFLSFSSCKSSKRAKNKNPSSREIITKKNKEDLLVENSENIKNEASIEEETSKSRAEYIIDYAKQFEGVRYKWGGTTTSGMDCSGLVYESFRAYDVILPRISRDMAKQGDKISLKNVNTGDLLFFKTGNRRNSINHVGLIISIRDNNIEFIHATTSKGVMTSWLNETYWLKAFTEARRIL